LLPLDIIFKLKCTKFDFSWGSGPDPVGGAYSAPPDPLIPFKGPIDKRRERRKDGIALKYALLVSQ